MRISIAIAALAVSPAVVRGQGTPGKNITVAVDVARVQRRGDTTRTEYVVRNSSQSQEALGEFMVDAPSPVLWISLPQPAESWLTNTRAKTLSVARWAALEPFLGPGINTPTLSFDATGLPTVVTYWAGGSYETPEGESDEVAALPPPREALAAHAVVGQTVGVEPLPTDLTPASLLGRLVGLLDQTCGALGWITSSSVCTSLDARLDAATQAVSQGNNAAARTEIENVMAEVEAQHGSGLPVNDGAYWLLKVNAEYILGRIPQ